MVVTFIVPCYNEQDNVKLFHSTFAEVFASCPIEWHLIMVDDGSADATYDLLSEIAQKDDHVTAIQFSRNFGKEAAIYAGLNASKTSDFVGIIDADLQQTPETALAMLRILLEDPQYDCVAAYQDQRNEGALMNFFKRSFYQVFARASRSSSVVANASDFRVFRRSVADSLLSMPEYHRFSKGLFSWVGFNTYAFPYTPEERNAGASKWSFTSLVNYAIEGILSFSTRPLHLVTVLGLGSSFLAVLYAVILIIKTLVVGKDVPGYASIVALILLFGGVQLLSLGIIGEYLGRLYEQEKRRPVYLIRDVINPMGE